MIARGVPGPAAALPAGVFTGYASLFGVADLGGDVMLPGAFRRSLARRGAGGIKLLHRHDPALLIGRWLQIEEDGKGLKVTGELHAGIARSAEILSLLTAGILDGLSIGFRTLSARSDPRSGLRRVAEVDLWEISIVTFPMLPGARVTAVGPAQDADLPAVIAKAAARFVTPSRFSARRAA